MIATGKRRKDIVDNNNYIRKFGQITFVCPVCGNLYSVMCNLNVDLHLDARPCELDGYSVTTPAIRKECNCGKETIQVDNAMGIIAKILIDKGYTIINCCEGHAYNEDAIISYDFPYLCIDGNIKSSIPSIYQNKLTIYEDFDKTIITCGNVEDEDSKDAIDESKCICPCCKCSDLEEYNSYKADMLSTIEALVRALPVLKKTDDDNSSTGCNCGTNCNCTCCQ